MHSLPALRQAQLVVWGASEHFAKRLHSQQRDVLAVGAKRRRFLGRGLMVLSSEPWVLELLLLLSVVVVGNSTATCIDSSVTACKEVIVFFLRDQFN